MRFEENHEALEEAAAPAKCSAAPGAKDSPAPLSPLTRAAIDIAVKKILNGLYFSVRCEWGPNHYDVDSQGMVSHAVRRWVDEQFKAYIHKEEIDQDLESAFDALMLREFSALPEDARKEIVHVLRDWELW